MSRSDYYFIYCKDSKGKRNGTTVCVILRDHRIFHGESTCSARDQFNKKVGRTLAFERAQESYMRYLARQGAVS